MPDCPGVLSLDECVAFCQQMRSFGKRIVLTNGCFDILHAGHINYLQSTAALADVMVVAVNSDASVKILKGPGRPINNQDNRVQTVAALRCVNAAFVFDGPRLENEILAISPEVYSKGGDYSLDTLNPLERDSLSKINAQIHFIPFVTGHSSTGVIDQLGTSPIEKDRLSFKSTLAELSTLIELLECIDSAVRDTAELIVNCLKSGGKLLTCGNGGSAADALHLAEELVGRYNKERRPLPAICMNADTTALTCIGNDYGYRKIFSRQLSGLGCDGDVFVGFSTSGNSENILEAISVANSKGLSTILVSGKDGGKAAGLCTHELIVPSSNTARIQEIHTVILHQWLEHIDNAFD